jgi:hypothetical protein
MLLKIEAWLQQFGILISEFKVIKIFKLYCKLLILSSIQHQPTAQSMLALVQAKLLMKMCVMNP